MRTNHLVDAELVGGLADFAIPTLSADILPGIRAAIGSIPVTPAVADGVAREECAIPGAHGDPDVRVLVYRPQDATPHMPGLLHIHGGGYVMGVPEMSDARCRTYARDLGCLVVSVGYRLAPEVPFPGPLEDCYAALQWLHGESSTLGVDPARLAITGESAGGGLAAAAALLARDRGEIALCYQALIYPMLDDRVGPGERANSYTGEFVWTPESNRFGWNAYLAGRAGSGDVPAHAAPARAADLAGLPATYIGIGSLDLFLDEDVEYAMRLLRAGVSVDLHVYPGAYHGFDSNPAAEVSAAIRADVMRALRRAFRVSG